MSACIIVVQPTHGYEHTPQSCKQCVLSPSNFSRPSHNKMTTIPKHGTVSVTPWFDTHFANHIMQSSCVEVTKMWFTRRGEVLHDAPEGVKIRRRDFNNPTAPASPFRDCSTFSKDGHAYVLGLGIDYEIEHNGIAIASLHRHHTHVVHPNHQQYALQRGD